MHARTLIAPQPPYAHARPKLPGLRLLCPRDRKRPLETGFGFCFIRLWRHQGDLAGNAIDLLIFSLAGGLLADRVGRKPVMIVPRIALVVLAYPAFLMMAEARTATVLLLTTALLTALNAIGAAVSLVLIPESLPKSVRSTGLSVAYAVGVTVFGGTTQFVITALIGA